MTRSQWIHREGFAPIFVGGPHVIWGLTGYILEQIRQGHFGGESYEYQYAMREETKQVYSAL
jgi:hypothetical protein